MKFSARQLASGALLFLGAFTAVASIAIASFLRDGLGPDAVPSEGVVVVSRTLEGAWPGLLLAAALAVCGFLIRKRWFATT
jgi:hypothetical protein